MKMNEIKYIVPSATLSERPDEFELRFIVPGIGKGDADLHIEGKTLTLKTHAKYSAPEGFKPAAEEFERVNYAMSVEVPEMADTTSLKAKIENGILTVLMKKRPETQPKKIEIL
jgi:HSP20 family protein